MGCGVDADASRHAIITASNRTARTSFHHILSSPPLLCVVAVSLHFPHPLCWLRLFFFPTARAFSAFVLCQCRLRSAAASTLCLKTACRCCSQCRVLGHVPVSLVPSTCRYDQRLHGTAAKQPKASNQKQASKHHYLVLTHVPVSLLCRASHQTQARATLLCPRHPSCCRQHPPGSFKSTCGIVCLLVS